MSVQQALGRVRSARVAHLENGRRKKQGEGVNVKTGGWEQGQKEHRTKPKYIISGRTYGQVCCIRYQVHFLAFGVKGNTAAELCRAHPFLRLLAIFLMCILWAMGHTLFFLLTVS